MIKLVCALSLFFVFNSAVAVAAHEAPSNKKIIEMNDSTPIHLKERPLPARANECQFCHIKRNNKEVFIPQKNKTQKEHFEIKIAHGTLKKSCNDCHDINNSNKLFAPATFENTSVLCSRCHIENYSEWKRGSHGKKITSWKNTTAYQCIDCHNPHDVSFKEMEAIAAPNPLRH